jgi:hypothetical protein
LLEIDNTLRTIPRCGEMARTDVAPIVVGCPPESPWEPLPGPAILGAMSVGNLARIAAVLAACAAAAGSASSRSSSSGSDQNPSLAAGNGAPAPQQMEANLALGLWRSTFGAVKIEADNSHGGLTAGNVQGIWMYERQGQEIIGYFAGNLRGNVLSFRWQEPNNPPLTGEGFLVFDTQGRQYSGRWWSDKRDRVGDWNGWRPPVGRGGRPDRESAGAYGGQDDGYEPAPYRRQQPYQPRPNQQPYQPSPYQQPYQQPPYQQPYPPSPYQQPYQQQPYQQPYAPSPNQQPPAQRQPPPQPTQPTYY